MPCRAVPCHAMPCRAVPCRAVPCRATFLAAHAYRRLQTVSMGKNNMVRGVQTSRRPCFIRCSPSRQTSLRRQYKSMAVRVGPAQGKFSGGGRWRGRESSISSSEMIQETTTVKIDSFHRIRQQPKRGLFYSHHIGLFFLLCSGGLKSSPIFVCIYLLHCCP